MLSSTAKFTFMALNSTTTPAATPTSRRRQHAAPDGAQYYLLVGAPYYAILFVLFMFLQPPYINAVCLAWPLASPHVAPCISILAMVGRIMNMATIQTQTSSVGGPSGPLVLAEPNRLDASCTLLRHGLTCQSPEPRTLPRSSSIEPRTRSSSIEPRTLPGWPQGLKGHNGHCWLCLSDCEQAPHIHICSMAGTDPSGVVGKSA